MQHNDVGVALGKWAGRTTGVAARTCARAGRQAAVCPGRAVCHLLCSDSNSGDSVGGFRSSDSPEMKSGPSGASQPTLDFYSGTGLDLKA